MSSTNYTIETPDEKKFRLIATGVVVLLLVAGGLYVAPILTAAVKGWLDFGIAVTKLALWGAATVFVIGSLWALRKPLFMKWKSLMQNMARAIYKTDLPGILSVIVANRKILLQNFADSVKKMLAAMGLHTGKLNKRKLAMQENLAYAKSFLDKSNDPKLSESERKIAADNSRHYAGEAAKDKDSLEKMIIEQEKQKKSYDFFDRMLNGLRNDTSSITNEIERMRDELETSETWRSAAENALKLVGVDPTEGMVIEETRKRIAENEATVVSMIMDNQQLLEKMEMKQDLMDESGQLLLDQYSQKIDVMSFTNLNSLPSAQKVKAKGSDFLENYKTLIQ